MADKQIKLQEKNTPTPSSASAIVQMIDIPRSFASSTTSTITPTNPTNSTNPTNPTNTGSSQHHVVLDIPINSHKNSKIVVKRSLVHDDDVKTFDSMLTSISSTLPYNHGINSISGWNANSMYQVQQLAETLKKESAHYNLLATRAKQKNLGMEILNLLFHSSIVFLNTSAFSSESVRISNISLAVISAFLNGIKSLLKLHKRAYQYAETALALEGLSRTLRVQLLTPPEQRREPAELVMFIETTRDKVLKKLIET